MLLVHDERLLGLVDAWLTGVSAEAFTDVLPLLRRTFSAYEPGVRRTLGELVRRGPARAGGGGRPATRGHPASAPDLDADARGRRAAGAAAAARPRRHPATRPMTDGGDARPDGWRTGHATTTTWERRETDDDDGGHGGADAPTSGCGAGGWCSAASAADGTGCALSGQDAAMDGALAALYGGRRRRRRQERGGTVRPGSAPPRRPVARWLGDIRTYFPTSVVQVMQRDAIDRLGLSALLLEPEMLEAVEADVHLVGTLLSLNKAMPETTKETARAVVRKVVEDLEKRLATRTRATLTGALDRSRADQPAAPPRHRLGPHDPGQPQELPARVPARSSPSGSSGTAAPSRSVKKEVVLCIDQSGSMAASVVYASVFGAVLASMRSIDTRLVVFDTAVVDLTDQLDDPVDVLFGTQLGGGTDINRALAYCQSQITRPADTVVVLISDLYEGGIRDEMLEAGRGDEGVRGAVRDAARAVRRGRARLRPRARGRARRAGRPGLRLHARPVPGGDGGGDREAAAADTGHRR